MGNPSEGLNLRAGHPAEVRKRFLRLVEVVLKRPASGQPCTSEVNAFFEGSAPDLVSCLGMYP